jgi:hypothetical protein
MEGTRNREAGGEDQRAENCARLIVSHAPKSPVPNCEKITCRTY